MINLDFAPTFLDYAGITIPDDMQGESMRQLLKGEKPINWRNEVYYHYYEYPKGGHDVKRHYGIRTHDFKLIHYYYDIDEWELFDLKNDPHELNNLYNNPDFDDKVNELKTKLVELRRKYKDNNQDDFLPKQRFNTVHHIVVGSSVSLANPYSKKYSGGGANALTDGKISVDNLSQVDNYEVFQGFQETDLIATIDLNEETEISSISAGFLHNTDAWIFSPDWVEFSVSNDGKSFQTLGKVERMIPVKSGKETRESFELETENITARFVRVHAKNIGTCPYWHKGVGGKAWLFADEIIV